MRLVGVALLGQLLRREVRRRHVRFWLGQRREAREALLQLRILGHVLEVAHQERAAVRARPAALAKRDDRLAREAAEVLLGPEDRASQRVIAERRPVDQVLGDRRRLVVCAVDLLDHDAALAVELLRVRRGRPTKSLSRSIAGPALSTRTVM